MSHAWTNDWQCPWCWERLNIPTTTPPVSWYGQVFKSKCPYCGNWIEVETTVDVRIDRATAPVVSDQPPTGYAYSDEPFRGRECPDDDAEDDDAYTCISSYPDDKVPSV